ncbi:deoxyribonuclease V [Planktothrix mougeotii]|uniref:Endonuclease V n=1 Tax=Planktothrix mougeotii LEGE 06226 TaxID=1828728 RepID=A0ABR9UBB5_9CYAN|nr:deoxyribonuclease V [Planktothrix mougeotii]MBE9143751.1 deoxyribonuclease V [Planktothrix mougeotii LEGE 06226]
MNIQRPETWPTTVEEAMVIQNQLKSLVRTTDELETVKYVAGVDVGFKQNYTISQAAVAVLSFPDLSVQETAIAQRSTTFPYIPGFLSFREVPVILDVLEKLTITPDLIICDGQGIAHPRRFGLACHLGVLIDQPTIGAAKSLLIGKHDDLPAEKGSWTPLQDKGEIIGAVLRSRTNVRPLYISPGHRISLETSIDYVLKCITQYRLPETTRWADKLASHT